VLELIHADFTTKIPVNFERIVYNILFKIIPFINCKIFLFFGLYSY